MRFGTAVLIGFIACAAIVAIADEPPPAESFYGIDLWQSPTGQGHALVFGPLSDKQCGAAQQRVQSESLPGTVSPDMQLRTGRCASQPQLVNILVPNGCSSSVPFNIPDMPAIRAWLYSCFRLLGH